MTQAAINAPAPVAAPAPAPNAPTELEGSVEERANAIFPAAFDDGEDGTEPEATEEAPAAAAPAPDAPKTSEQLAADRAARRAATLAELNAKTRNAVDAKSAQREAEALRRENEQLRERSKAYETYVDPKTLTKEQFFALAQQNPELSPQDLGNWLREQAADPAAAAGRAAKTAVDPVIAKMQQALDAANAKIDGFMQSQQSAVEEAQEREAFQSFAGFTQQNTATSPLAARFLDQHGAGEFQKLTMGAANALPPNAGPQALLDEIEDRLTELGKIYAAPAVTQRTQANPPRNAGTATQAPTHVTNSLAQQRSSVVDEAAALENLNYEERAANIFRRR